MGFWLQTGQEPRLFHLDVLELMFLPRSDLSPTQSPEGSLNQYGHAFCQYSWQIAHCFIALDLGVCIWPPGELSELLI